MATIGAEYMDKIIITRKYKVNLNLRDTAGQERFKSLVKMFFSGEKWDNFCL